MSTLLASREPRPPKRASSVSRATALEEEDDLAEPEPVWTVLLAPTMAHAASYTAPPCSIPCPEAMHWKPGHKRRFISHLLQRHLRGHEGHSPGLRQVPALSAIR